MIITKILAILAILAIQAALPDGSPGEQSAPPQASGYAWDCPGTGRLPYQASMLMEPAWLEARLGSPGLVVLHVEADPGADGLRETYEAGHVPGARALSWKMLAAPPGAPSGALPSVEQRILALRLLGIRGDERLVLYDTGRGFEAARAFLLLDSVGLGRNAALLNGQWERWRDEGRAVSSSVPAPEASSFEPRLRRASVASRIAIRDYIWAAHQDPAGATILDLRSAREPEVPSVGPDFIPGSVRIPWESLFSCGAAPRLPDEDRLRRIFRGAVPFANRPLLVVGGSPGEAAFGWFTARLLGYPARVSEEIFEEWRARTHPEEWSDPERHGLAPPPKS